MPACSSPPSPTGGRKPKPARRSRRSPARPRRLCGSRKIRTFWPTIGHHAKRPALVVGFAAETQNLVEHARAKLAKKGADIIVANDVSHDSGVGPSGVMGGDRNLVRIVTAAGVEEWPEMSKAEVAERLAGLVAERLAGAV